MATTSIEQNVKHTPGPWVATKGGGNAPDNASTHWGDIEEQFGDQYSVATVWADVPELEPCAEANANLMAAAPDLLMACKAIEETCPCDNDLTTEFNAAWMLLLAAIAKAEGGK